MSAPKPQMAALARAAIDQRVQPLREHRDATARPVGGWVRAIRTALGMSTDDLARRLGASSPSVRRLESRERDGAVRLRELERAAEAMGCELVYAFVPRTSLLDMVEQRARSVADTHVRRADWTMALEGQRTSSAARDELRGRVAAEAVSSPDLWHDSSLTE